MFVVVKVRVVNNLVFGSVMDVMFDSKWSGIKLKLSFKLCDLFLICIIIFNI